MGAFIPTYRLYKIASKYFFKNSYSEVIFENIFEIEKIISKMENYFHFGMVIKAFIFIMKKIFYVKKPIAAGSSNGFCD